MAVAAGTYSDDAGIAASATRCRREAGEWEVALRGSALLT
jgi:hypothetical protein